MIIFTLEASNFIAAGKIEQLLKENKIPFTTKIVNATPKRRTHTRVTPEMIKDILGYLATHSSESNETVSDNFDVGANTIWRIRSGSHPLCQKK